MPLDVQNDDQLAFTGSIGENSSLIRNQICTGFEFMGLHFDEKKNAALKLTGYEASQIQKENSRVKVIVAQTREEWMIAQDVECILGKGCTVNAKMLRLRCTNQDSV